MRALLKLPIHILRQINEESLLKSALYSARIEGNTMTWEEARQFYFEDKLQSLGQRQKKIYEILGNNNVVSFNEISRNFTNVPKRTLRYDLKKLQEKNLIIKIGETRGTYYKVNHEIIPSPAVGSQ